METLLLVGFALGLRHSADADHVAAMTSLLSEASSAHSAQAIRAGALWGLGHLLAVLVAGSAIVALRVRMPAWLEWSLEFLVACILIWLGIRTLGNCFRGRYHFHLHRHGGWPHAHLHFHSQHEAAHVHDPHAGAGRRPLWIGMAHGLAGTAGLTLLVLASIPSQRAGVLYLLCFGVGALVGMVAFSAVVHWSLAQLARSGRQALWLGAFRLLAGTVNGVLGATLAYHSMLPGSFPF